MTPVIDLHLDSFIWTRMFGYDITKSHDKTFGRGRFGGQVDVPRLTAGSFTGGLWSITTNPFRSGASRADAFRKNCARFAEIIKNNSTSLKLVSAYPDFESAMHEKKHAVWMTVQGGNALDHDLSLIPEYAPYLTAVTLMHLTHSSLGTSSSPHPTLKKRGLTKLGEEFIQALNENKIFVDLAHSDSETFWDVMKVHDRTQPVMVSHTGVKGAHDHWRNLNDDQLKAVANTGGVVGVIFHAGYLGKGTSGFEQILLHLKHIQNVAGEDAAAIGSDWDGFILPPKELRNCVNFPELVKRMKEHGMTSAQIDKILGLNFLRAFRTLRPARA
jgi:membrane dipeptidase